MKKVRSIFLMLIVASMATVLHGVPVMSEGTDVEIAVKAAIEAYKQGKSPVVEFMEENKNEIELFAIEPDTTYQIAYNQTISFISLSKIDLNVEISDYVDCVVYYRDGSVKEYYRDAKVGKISVPAEGKIKITSRRNIVKCSVPDDYFVKQDEVKPVFVKKIIDDGETYTFTNISNIPMKVLSNDKKIDQVVFGRDGSFVEQGREKNWKEKIVSAKESLKITSREDGAEICVLGDYFTAEKQDTVVFRKRILISGETYSYTNVSDVPYDILLSGLGGLNIYFDYVMYDGSGEITSHVRNSVNGNGKISIPSGSTIKITSREKKMEICGLTEYFTVKREQQHVYKKILICSDNTYSFSNTSDKDYTLAIYGDYYYYVIYDREGTIISYKKQKVDSGTRYISIPSGSRLKITSCNSNTEVCALTEKFDVKEENTSVVKKMVIPSGSTYSFTNTSNDEYSLYVKGSCFDYVMSDESGAIKLQYADNDLSTGRIDVPGGYKIKITANDYGIDVAGLTEIFTISKEKTPVYRSAKYSTGETYLVKNISESSYELRYTGYADYIIYTESGDIADYRINVKASSMPKQLKSGYSMKLTSRGVFSVYALYDMFELEKTDTPVFKTVIVPSGEECTFTNIGSKEYKILTNGVKSDSVIRDSSGDEISSAVNKNISGTDIPSGCSITVTALSSDTEFSVLNEYFTASSQNVTGTVLSQGISYEIFNLTATDYTLNRSSEFIYYDYIIYGAEGAVAGYGYNASKTKVVIPSGGKAILTPRTTFYMTDSSNIKIKEVENPVYNVTEIKCGETYLFKNKSLSSLNMTMLDMSYDYIMYNIDGTVNQYVPDKELSSLAVPAGCSVAITSKYGNTEIASLYNDFSIERVNDECFDSVELIPGETLRIENILPKNCDVIIGNPLYDYVIYNADGSINSYVHDSTSKTLTLSSNAYAIITSRASITVWLMKGMFEYSDYDKPVFEYTGIYKGGTAVVKNKHIKDYDIFVRASSYDKVIYDANNDISASAMAESVWKHTMASDVSEAITATDSNVTIITLNGYFDIKTRDYPALFRQVVYDGEKYTFANNYKNTLPLLTNEMKLKYDAYTEYGTVEDYGEDVIRKTIDVAAGGKAEIEARSCNVLIAGAYEAFSGEDLAVSVTGIRLSNSNINIAEGGQSLIRAEVIPDESTNKNVWWESSDPDIVTVVQTGKVIGKKTGVATVTATTEDGDFSASCTVNVLEAGQDKVNVSGVKINKISLELAVNESETLSASVIPANATEQTIIWTSTNTSVATVFDGVVTARTPGNATIIAISLDGSYTAMCTVTVPDVGTAGNIVISGKDSNGIRWFLYDDGTFEVSGNGAMEDYTSTYDIPWYDYRGDIKNIVVGKGVTHIALKAFYNCINVIKADIPKDVVSIGKYAFRNCDMLTIYGVIGSYAHKYANDNNIPFVPLSELPDMKVETSSNISRRYFDVTLDCYEGDATVYAAIYDDEDRLVSVSSEVMEKDDITSLSVTKTDKDKIARIMMWNDGMQPVANVYEISLD